MHTDPAAFLVGRRHAKLPSDDAYVQDRIFAAQRLDESELSTVSFERSITSKHPPTPCLCRQGQAREILFPPLLDTKLLCL